MKNKYKFICCVFAFSLILGGCNKAKVTDESSKTINSRSENSSNLESILKESGSQYSDDYPVYTFESRYEYLRKKYPGKTVLVFSAMNGGRYEKELNELLDKEKKDYAICFKDVTDDKELLDTEKGFVSSYLKELSEALNNNEQIDIISSGGVFSGVDGCYNSYHKCVDNGWFEPWDDYLTGNENGRKLKSVMSEKYWESLKLDGKIYGFDGSLSCLKDESGFMYNAKLYKENKNSKNQTYSEMLKSNIKYCTEKGYQCSFPNLCAPASYSDFNFVTDCLYIDKDVGIKNFYESKYAKEIFNEVAAGYKSKAVFNSYTGQCESIDKYYCNSIDSPCGHFANNNLKTDEENGLAVGEQTVCGYTVFPKYDEKIYGASSAVGVYKGSENKEKAFEAVTDIMTNKDINNLLCFGTDLEFKDECVQPQGHYNTSEIENRLIRYPFYGVNQKDSNEKLKQALEDFQLEDTVGINFDYSNVEKQVNEVSKIVMHIDEEFPSDKCKTGEEYLKELNKRLDKAGLKDIRLEIERQMKTGDKK